MSDGVTVTGEQSSLYVYSVDFVVSHSSSMLSKSKVVVVLSDTLLPYKLEGLGIPLDVRVAPPPVARSPLIPLLYLSQPRAERESFSLCPPLLIQRGNSRHLILDYWYPVFKVCEGSVRGHPSEA